MIQRDKAEKFSAEFEENTMADAAIQGAEHNDDRGFFTRWFMSTNHKDIGILYLVVSAFVGFIAVAFTVYMRLELMNLAFNICVWKRAINCSCRR